MRRLGDRVFSLQLSDEVIVYRQRSSRLFAFEELGGLGEFTPHDKFTVRFRQVDDSLSALACRLILD